MKIRAQLRLSLMLRDQQVSLVGFGLVSKPSRCCSFWIMRRECRPNMRPIGKLHSLDAVSSRGGKDRVILAALRIGFPSRRDDSTAWPTAHWLLRPAETVPDISGETAHLAAPFVGSATGVQLHARPTAEASTTPTRVRASRAQSGPGPLQDCETIPPGNAPESVRQGRHPRTQRFQSHPLVVVDAKARSGQLPRNPRKSQCGSVLPRTGTPAWVFVVPVLK